MHELIQKVAESQGSGLIVAATAFLVGVILWLAGRRMLRTAFGAAGLLAGTLAGLAISEIPRVAEVGVPAWVITLVAALLVAILFAAAYRLALAASVGLLLAALTPVLVLAAAERGWIHFQGDEALASSPPTAAGEPGLTQEVLGSLPPPPLEGAAEPGQANEPAGEAEHVELSSTLAEDLPKWRQWLTATVDAVTAAPARVWDASPEPLRWILAAAAGCGAILGLVVGAAAPSAGASILTAMFGSLLLLGGGWTLAVKLSLPTRLLPESSLAWLAWWMGAAVIGLGLQWILRPKPADK